MQKKESILNTLIFVNKNNTYFYNINIIFIILQHYKTKILFKTLLLIFYTYFKVLNKSITITVTKLCTDIYFHRKVKTMTFISAYTRRFIIDQEY